jgi:hypothetical protein
MTETNPDPRPPVRADECVAGWGRCKKALAAVLLLAAGAALGVGYFRLRTALGEVETANSNLEQANKSLGDEKDQREKALAVTLAALDAAFFELSDQLKDLPGSELIRLEILKRARRTLDGLNEFCADDPRIQNYRMQGYDKLGSLEAGFGMLAAAEESFILVRTIAAQLEARFPENPLYAQNRAIATAKIAGLSVRRGDYKTADELVDAVAPVAARQVSAHPNDLKALELESIVRSYLYERAVRSASWQNTEPLMRERCALYRRLARADPDNPARKRDVIDGDRELATLLMNFNKTDEAGPVLLRATVAADALPDRTAPPVRRLRAAVYSALGGYHDSRRESPQAIAAYTTAREEYEWLARRFENVPLYRYQQATVLYSLSITTAQTGDVKSAIRHLEKSEQLLAELTQLNKTDTQYRTMYDKVTGLLNKIRTPKDK